MARMQGIFDGYAARGRRLALAVCAVLLLGACDSGSGTAKPSPSMGPNPLTGEPGPAGKVVAVKIDNVTTSIQGKQAGLNSADIVYAIQVEGGLSRFLAVFDSSHLPPSTGPVRSARETDVPILAAYGKVAFVYSGAISGLLPELKSANLFNVTPTTYPGFSNGGSDPTFVDPGAVLAAFPGAAQAQDVGLRFAATPPPGGTPATTVTARMPSASFGFTWDGTQYVVSEDGHAATDGGQRDTTANVIVQHVKVVPGQFTDYNSGQAANEVFSQTTGSGDADVYRNGVVYHATWNKPTDTSPTSYVFDGAPLTLQPGRTWIVLAQ